MCVLCLPVWNKIKTGKEQERWKADVEVGLLCVVLVSQTGAVSHLPLSTCTHAYVRMHMHTRTHTCAHTHMHTCMHKHTHTCIHTYTCIRMHIHTHTHAYTHTHVCAHTSTYTHRQTDMHTYTHTHTHINVQTGSQKRTGKGLPVLPLKQSHMMLVCSTMPGSHPFKVECGIQNKAKITFIF